ncbi:MAG: hypothetical protein BWK73_47700 [Thiothrix lacustris]|uniref:Uncharacterized protein n=1 Tax=Thiothrix lacustris TaxID=525917 RepID=A0A1Y1Q9U1_9GAMM|nr:MAG: hypothetical protein BWK73_47700 [Thiothrix lacustris]
MQLQLKPEFEEILEPLGENAAAFFLAAGLYYAHKVSFSAAAALADLSFDEFLHRLKEYFDVGFQVADEAVLEDLQTVKRQRVSDDLGKSLHDRATRGYPLSDEEGAQLQCWYDEQDAEEAAMLGQRVGDLIQKFKNASLSPEEQMELDYCMKLEHQMRLFKAHAQQLKLIFDDCPIKR